MKDPLASAFQRLAHEFLASRPSLRHEWREDRSRWLGNRLHLVFEPPSAGVPEVFVSLNEGQITVGTGMAHEDFEDFGRGKTEDQIAQAALSGLIELLKRHGYATD